MEDEIFHGAMIGIVLIDLRFMTDSLQSQLIGIQSL